MRRLVMATRNQGKAAELRRAFLGLGLEVACLADEPTDLEIEEDGDTFEANAIKKAKEVAAFFGELSLADDSGLSVDALGGEPGVRSARYGGPGLSDAQRCDLLLEALRDVTDERRGARFHCVLALCEPGGEATLFCGVLEGRIAHVATGAHGFGYDPVFVPAGFERSLAELGPQIKQRISHRATALVALVHHLRAASSQARPLIS